MIDPEIQKAEKNLIVNILTALADKRVIGGVVAAVVALSSYVVYWTQSHITTTNEAAAGTDPCCVVQAAAQGKGIVATNSLAKVIWLGCALSACKPQPVNPPPVPSAMGGSTSMPTATGGALGTGGQGSTGGFSAVAVVTFPACSNTMKAPSAAEIDQYKRTLKPRHKSRPHAKRAPVSPVDAALVNVFWPSNLATPLDQGSLGSCTGNASAQCVSTKPFGLQLNENNAVDIYSLATKLDSYPGTYPPTDTGSDGASACKALIQLGYAKSCTNFTGYTDALARVQSQPIIVGMNWLNDMFTPNSCGGLSVSGPVEGGHEIEVVGYDAGNKRVWLQNSWGNSWGVCVSAHCGYFYLGINDLAGSVLDAEFDGPNQ